MSNLVAANMNARQTAPAKPARSVIEVKDLHVSFPVYGTAAVTALSGIDLSIKQGEVVGLVGESGSGKTVLARAIMGLVPPPGRIDRGEVLFEGRSLLTLPEVELSRIRGRQIAMIIPNPRTELNPLMKVGRQIANLARFHLGINKQEAAQLALEMLRQVQIPDHMRRFNAYPHELSGGMAQRVVMANALVCSPKFIISDDATSGLDVTIQAQVLDLLRRLVREHNTSTLFITRDIGITAHFCDRVAVIYEGEIVELANTAAFFQNPSHPYSVMLLAAFCHNPSLRKMWTMEGQFQKRRGAGDVCSFAPRCVCARERCHQEGERPLQEVGPGHFVRCHYPLER